MRLAVIGPTYPFRGGIAHYTTLLVRALRTAGHTVEFISFARQYPRLLFPGSTDRDPSRAPLIEPCRYLIDPFRPWSWRSVAEQVRQMAPDLVLLQWWVPYWSPLFVLLMHWIRQAGGPPIAVIVHNLLPHDGGGPLDRRLTRLALQQADALCVHSASEARRVAALLPQVLTVTLRMPAFRPLLDPPAAHDELAALRLRLALPTDRRLLLCFGFVRPYKGLRRLLEALAALPSTERPHLLIVGEIWRERRQLAAEVRRLRLQEQLTLIDRYVANEELPALFAVADALVLPYLSASQSAVAPLALAAGKPLIATAVGGLPELLRDGVDSLLVPVNDRAALTAALRQLNDDSVMARLRTAAAAQAAQRSDDWPLLVEQVRALVEQLQRR